MLKNKSQISHYLWDMSVSNGSETLKRCKIGDCTPEQIWILTWILFFIVLSLNLCGVVLSSLGLLSHCWFWVSLLILTVPERCFFFLFFLMDRLFSKMCCCFDTVCLFSAWCAGFLDPGLIQEEDNGESPFPSQNKE